MEQVFDVEQPKDVEQVQRCGKAKRCGTSPKRWNRGKINNTFQCFKKKMVVAPDVEQVFNVEQLKDVEQTKDVEQAQRGGTGPKTWNRGKISNTLYVLGKKKSRCRPRFRTSTICRVRHDVVMVESGRPKMTCKLRAIRQVAPGVQAAPH